MREKLHRSLLKLRGWYRAGVKRSRYKRKWPNSTPVWVLHVDVRDFERARKLTECDVEEYFGFEFYKKNDTERDAYLTACGAA